MTAHESREVRAADFLLALEEELHVERKTALLGQESLSGFENDVDRPFVICRPAPAHDVTVHGQLERGRDPLGQVTRGLHVVVPVDENGRRPGGAEPLALDDGMAIGLHHAAVCEPQLLSQPLRRGMHRGGCRVPAHARHRDELGEFPQVADIIGIKGKHCHRQSRSSARLPRRTVPRRRTARHWRCPPVLPASASRCP